MESKIAKAIAIKQEPVALIWSDQKPEEAVQFKERKWGCIMWLVAGAAKGKTAVCDRRTFGCIGGGVGAGFGEQYKNFPGGEECFCHFLSYGNTNWDQGRAEAQNIEPYVTKETYDNFLHGERYLKNPEMVKKFIDCLPITDVPVEYVVFKPLTDVDAHNEKPQVIIFFADPDQLSALVVLANYGRGDNENVIIPYAAGCQTIGIYPIKEAAAERPRAVVGLTDLSARVHVRRLLGNHLMTFAAPLGLFREMEDNVVGSFLERPTWKSLLKTT